MNKAWPRYVPVLAYGNSMMQGYGGNMMPQGMQGYGGNMQTYGGHVTQEYGRYVNQGNGGY